MKVQQTSVLYIRRYLAFTKYFLPALLRMETWNTLINLPLDVFATAVRNDAQLGFGCSLHTPFASNCRKEDYDCLLDGFMISLLLHREDIVNVRKFTGPFNKIFTLWQSIFLNYFYLFIFSEMSHLLSTVTTSIHRPHLLDNISLAHFLTPALGSDFSVMFFCMMRTRQSLTTAC